MVYAQYNTPEKAWAALRWYVHETYAPLAAMYTGDPPDLKRTGKPRSFWRRAKDGTAVHVPIAADIASTSADLLFSHPPKCTVFHGDDRSAEERQQARLNEILDLNRFPGKLSEAAETASALGDVYFKLRWTEDADMPLIDIVQPDSALPEYAAGRLARIHFFTPLFVDYEKNRWIRVYECYEPGRIASAAVFGRRRKPRNCAGRCKASGNGHRAHCGASDRRSPPPCTSPTSARTAGSANRCAAAAIWTACAACATRWTRRIPAGFATSGSPRRGRSCRPNTFAASPAR